MRFEVVGGVLVARNISSVAHKAFYNQQTEVDDADASKQAKGNTASETAKPANKVSNVSEVSKANKANDVNDVSAAKRFERSGVSLAQR